jgi:hypothetical protein
MRPKLLAEAQRCREEAARLRVDVRRFSDENIRRRILDIAAQYDQLAESLDLHAASRMPDL